MIIDDTNRNILHYTWKLEEKVSGQPGKQEDKGKMREERRKGKEKVKDWREFWYPVKETAQNAPDPEKEVRDRFDLTGKSPYTRLEQV